MNVLRNFRYCLALITLAVFCISAQNDFKDGFIRYLDTEVLSYGKISADFTVIRSVPMISGTVTDKGHMELSSEGQLLWHIISPKDRKYVIDPSKMDSGDVPPVQRRIMRMVAEFRTRPPYRDERNLTVAVSRISKAQVCMSLTPRRGELASLFSKIDVFVDTDAGVVREINMMASNGAVTKVVFDNVIKTERK